MMILMFALVSVLAVSLEIEQAAKRIPEESERSAQKKVYIPLPSYMAEFFLRGLEPKADIPQGKYHYIEQMLDGKGPYFVTLFNGDEHNPVYSAYTIDPLQAEKLSTNQRCDLGEKAIWRETPETKGMNRMYSENYKAYGITRGHMDPCVMNTFDLNYMEATFTLTNAVPQYEASNKAWGYYEERLMQYAKHCCRLRPGGGILFALTGSSTMKGRIQGHMKSVPPRPTDLRVAIPDFVWMAACCVWTDASKVERAESLAAKIENKNDVSQLYGKVITLQDLEGLLTVPGKSTVRLFPGDSNCRANSEMDWAK